jgi:hypothetical protein
LDLAAANAHIGPWLQSVANARVHATTEEVPAARLMIERAHLKALPQTALIAAPTHTAYVRRPVPCESLQHPLSMYESLLEVA